MTFTAREKAECAERELRHRIRVYSRRVGEGRMSGHFADLQIAMMREIAADYRRKAEAEEREDRLI